jgi:hypothetical protein
MANTNGSEDPLANFLYATNGMDTEDKVKSAIKTLVANNLFLDDTDLSNITDSTQLAYALTKKKTVMLLIIVIISKVTAFDASALLANYQHVLDSVKKRLASLQGAGSSRTGFSRNRQRSPPPRPNGKLNGRSQSRGGWGSKRQRPNVTCSKCQRNHETKDCVAQWSKSGVFLGKGTPPASHYWAKQNNKQASDSLKFKDKQKQATTAAVTNKQPVRQRLHPQPSKGKGKLPTRFAKALLIQTSETSDLNNISPLQDSDVVMEEDSFTSAIDNTEPQWKSVHEDESELESDSEEEVEVKRRTVQSLNKQVPEPSAQARGTRCNKPLTPYQHDLHTKAYYKQKKKVHFKANRG